MSTITYSYTLPVNINGCRALYTKTLLSWVTFSSMNIEVTIRLDPALHISEDVLFMILVFLDPRSLCRCARLNSTWRRIASDNILWKKLLQYKSWSSLTYSINSGDTIAALLPSRKDQKRARISYKSLFRDRFSKICNTNIKDYNPIVTAMGNHIGGNITALARCPIDRQKDFPYKIASASWDGTIKLWDTPLLLDPDHKQVTHMFRVPPVKIYEDTPRITSMIWEGDSIFCGHDAGYISRWPEDALLSARRGEPYPLYILPICKSTIWSLKYRQIEGAGFLASATMGSTLKMHRFSSSGVDLVATLDGCRCSRDICFVKGDIPSLLIGCLNKKIEWWYFELGIRAELPIDAGVIKMVADHEDPNVFYLGMDDGRVCSYDIRANHLERISSYVGEKPITQLSLNPEGTMLFSLAPRDKQISHLHIWDKKARKSQEIPLRGEKCMPSHIESFSSKLYVSVGTTLVMHNFAYRVPPKHSRKKKKN